MTEAATEKSLSEELIAGGMKKDLAMTSQTLLIKIGQRTRRAAYIEEILGDMATLHEFKKDMLMYIRFLGAINSGLRLLMMHGYICFVKTTGEYAITQKGFQRVEKFLPKIR